MAVNAQYNIARPGSLPVRIAEHQRRKMFDRFCQTMAISGPDTLLDVGATSDRDYDHSNYLEAWWPHKAGITSVGIDDAGFLEHQYPGLRFVRADGCQLPFADAAFDFVDSSAVLEHLGTRQRQTQFVGELWRVARRGIFLTTPNRWFPIEFHTLLPLLHWLPRHWHRRALTALGQSFFAAEANLHLVSSADLRAIAIAAGIGWFRIETAALLGLPTNLLLIAGKDEPITVTVRDQNRIGAAALEAVR
jgi:hypothetical protein